MKAPKVSNNPDQKPLLTVIAPLDLPLGVGFAVVLVVGVATGPGLLIFSDQAPVTTPVPFVPFKKGAATVTCRLFNVSVSASFQCACHEHFMGKKEQVLIGPWSNAEIGMRSNIRRT
jgi:hypothetical protein